MAHTKTVGWILYSLPSMNVEFWTSTVNEWIAKHFPCENIPIGLEHRAIFDGAGKEVKQQMSKDERWAKCCLHVLCKHGVCTHVTALICAFLHSKEFSSLCKVPACLIPPLPYSASLIFWQKYEDATVKHMKVTYFGTSSQTTFDFSNPNKLCHVLEGRQPYDSHSPSFHHGLELDHPLVLIH